MQLNMKKHLLLFTTLILTINNSYACDCEPWYEKVEDWYENAPIAIEGTIISREYFGQNDTTWTTDSKGNSIMEIRMDENAYDMFEVRVTTNYRNITIDSTITLTSIANSSCSSNFDVGKSYILFAFKKDDGTYYTDVCYGSRLSNQEDNEAIRKIKK